MVSNIKRQKLMVVKDDDLFLESEAQESTIKLNPHAIDDLFLEMEKNLCSKLLASNFGNKVSYIYNPIEYAKSLHESYVRKFCTGAKDILLLGMNPGPWGMCQTGVPFGHVGHVKDWLKLTGEVKKPTHEHKNRPIDGLNCKRSEVSGDRMWKLLAELSGEPSVLFRHIFLHNYCPLAFMSDSGKNVTPAELKASERKSLEKACDDALIEAVTILKIKYLVGIGNYVVQRANKAFQSASITNIEIITLMHPSPANPTANKRWREIAIDQLKNANILKYFGCEDQLP